MINPDTQLKSQFRNTPIECQMATISQLVTSDGLSKAKGFYIGQQVIIDINSKRVCTVETKTVNGIIKHQKWIYNIIDINGKPLGWICAEWCFKDMIVL